MHGEAANDWRCGGPECTRDMTNIQPQPDHRKLNYNLYNTDKKTSTMFTLPEIQVLRNIALHFTSRNIKTSGETEKMLNGDNKTGFLLSQGQTTAKLYSDSGWS